MVMCLREMIELIKWTENFNSKSWNRKEKNWKNRDNKIFKKTAYLKQLLVSVSFYECHTRDDVNGEGNEECSHNRINRSEEWNGQSQEPYDENNGHTCYCFKYKSAAVMNSHQFLPCQKQWIHIQQQGNVLNQIIKKIKEMSDKVEL